MHVYLVIVSLFSFLLLPYFLFKYLKNPYEWKQRLGFIQIPQHNKKTIWFHAASVGEVNALIPLIKEFIEEYNDRFYVVMSTMTMTGHERAKQFSSRFPEDVSPILFPLDIPNVIKRVLKRISPDILVIAETEIWPALIHYTHFSGIKILLVNGRISPKTVRSFNKYSFLFKNTLKRFDEIGVQTEDDKKRFEEVTDSPVAVTGNLKFALHLPEYSVDSIRKEWHLTAPFIITFGSSRPEEELLVAQLYNFLKKKDINFQIILAPRHLRRLEEIEKLLTLNHVQFQKLSEISSPENLLLIDTMGELTKAYAVSDIAVVGGSFYDFTGHNPLEPAYFSKPIIMGPYFSSCKESVAMLVSADAITITQKEKLPDCIVELYKNPQKRFDMGQHAKEVMELNKYALEKTLRMIEKYL